MTPAIAADNSAVQVLPSEAITVVHRSDGSGTTGIFTHYLSQTSPDWKAGPGQGTTVNWPTGVGAKGNDGVAQAVKTTEGAIGYNELGYVLQNGITYAAVQNADSSGFLRPSVATVAAAAAAVDQHPGRPALLQHERARRTVVPDLWLLVHRRLQEPERFRQGRGHRHRLSGT